MKKKITIVLAVVVIFAIGTAEMMDPGGKVGYTGSPGEGTCADAGCHTGTAVNGGGGSVVISSINLSNWKYTPGQKYTISVTVSQTGRGLFGFDFEALEASGKSAGTMTVTNSAEMTLGQKTVAGNQRKCMTHKLNGGKTNNSHAFTFDWTAPSTSVGDITFYATGNACNGNGSASGDLVYKTSQVVNLDNTSIENGISLHGSSNFYYNPSSRELTIVVNKVNMHPEISIELLSLNGQQAISIAHKDPVFGDSFSKSAYLPDHISSGIYFLKLYNGHETSVKKILIQ